MAEAPSSVRICFCKTNRANSYERAIEVWTGGPWVHAELEIPGVGRWSAFDKPVEPFCRSLRSHYDYAFEYKLTPEHAKELHAYVLRIIARAPAYNRRDLWQCCVKLFLPLESDLDPQTPESWNRVFCSQAVLLALKHMLASDMLKFSPRGSQRVHTLNSRGCSPNYLFRMLLDEHEAGRGGPAVQHW